MDKQYQTVVQGEASESDSEEEEIENDPTPLVIEGEADESDEEKPNMNDAPRKKELPALKLREYSTSFETLDDTPTGPPLLHKKPGKPKHGTVLNRKLWESNLSLCNSLSNLISHTYLTAAKDITNCSQQVSRSHTLVQDVSHNMRLMTNDLFNLHDRIDIVTSCKILPLISIPQKSPPQKTSSQQSLQSSSLQSGAAGII
ncbi:biogenesis of lysosome-related organelles complex 1 subunit 3 [Plakobranchus ocellatus]|uniref:Biogenesis of lysosome-related organelles complex 1 subunit 3 n=1 Tax=Plakobranchus ocellatus TaxID=259542 RepID=A0AAV3YNX6_9GAST|nr:biogenesis of lysosome-related organelles complex 1 subunit 3 [Plakobranchus ocellatus]